MQPSTALSTLEDAGARGDLVRFWREPRLGGLECLSATFRRHRYQPHTHETYAVAAVLEGCEAFQHRGERRYATPGTIAVVGPDELHDGEPAGGSFIYRTIYPTIGQMRAAAQDVFGRPFAGTPSFAVSVVPDPALAADLAHLHAVLADPHTPFLQRDTLMTAFLAGLLGRWAGAGAPPPVGRETAPVARVRDYLDARFAEDVTLDDLAAVARLNRAHLVRSFRKATGTTPHAYLLDRRFRAAGRRLAAGEAPAEVAAACGFCDQSHLNRVFKARMGVTPGAFRGRIAGP